LTPAREFSWEASDRGAIVAAGAATGPGLPGILFSARALPLTGALAESEVADYLSGMLLSDVADRARVLQSAWEQAGTSLTRGARS
jgi:2-keto-3-deoxy-galactonokinase